MLLCHMCPLHRRLLWLCVKSCRSTETFGYSTFQALMLARKTKAQVHKLQCILRPVASSPYFWTSMADSSIFEVVVKNTFISVITEEDLCQTVFRRQVSAPADLWAGGEATKVQKADEDTCSTVASDDQRTSVMIRNLPATCNLGGLVQMIRDQGFGNSCDFIYLPIKFLTNAAFGYAFVNFTTAAATQDFWNRCQGLEFAGQRLSLSWSDIQGLDEQTARYRNSPVMHPSVPAFFRPLLFKNGMPIPFPAPTQHIKPPKIRACRSRPPASHSM